MPLDLSDFESLLPPAVDWCRAQEKLILENGVPLDGWELHAAQKLGVLLPERVRLLRVRQVPLPADASLCAAAQAAGLVSAESLGMALRHGIFVREDIWRERALIVHELAHTAQYERLGGFEPFLRQYFSECFLHGYPSAPLEQEAVRRCRLIMKELAHP